MGFIRAVSGGQAFISRKFVREHEEPQMGRGDLSKSRFVETLGQKRYEKTRLTLLDCL